VAPLQNCIHPAEIGFIGIAAMTPALPQSAKPR
jgi:hypothetical protein